MRALWRLVRAGLADTAQQLCVQRGHSWCAVTLPGWMPFHEPNLEDDLAPGTVE